MIRACRFCYDCSCHSHYCNTVHCLYDYSSFSTMTKESMASSPFFHSKHRSSISLVPSSLFWMCTHNFSNNSSLAFGRLRLFNLKKRQHNKQTQQTLRIQYSMQILWLGFVKVHFVAVRSVPKTSAQLKVIYFNFHVRRVSSSFRSALRRRAEWAVGRAKRV